MENGKQSDISIATPQHPLMTRNAAVATAIVAITVFRATCCNCCNPATLVPSLHFSTRTESVVYRRESGRKVYTRVGLYYSVSDDLWRDASRYVTVTAKPRYRNTRSSPMLNTNRLSCRRYDDTTRIFAHLSCEYSLRHNDANAIVIILRPSVGRTYDELRY